MKDKNQAGQDMAIELLHLFAYHNPANRKVTALNLWTNGHRLFGQAKVIKDFDILKNIPQSKSQAPPLELILPFLYENIMDKTRVITCFENYMKGLLLIKGYIAHKLSPRDKTLRNAQNTRPIEIAEVFSASSFAPWPSSDTSDYPTTPHTLTFSVLLHPAYQSVLQLPANIVTILSTMNEERNKLHFLAGIGFSIGKPIVKELEQLIGFVTNGIGLQIMALNRELQGARGALIADNNLKEGFRL